MNEFIQENSLIKMELKKSELGGNGLFLKEDIKYQ